MYRDMPKRIGLVIIIIGMLLILGCGGGEEVIEPLTYVGEVKDGEPHGKGTFIWQDGRKYEGDWKEGKTHGQGKYSYPDGSVETGRWEAGEYAGDE